MPLMSSRIVMKVMDKDIVKDEVVGSILFNLKEIVQNKNGDFFWKNIYGSPLGVSGQNVDLMNSNPEIASTWKGRILMKATSGETEKPECKSLKMSKKFLDEI